MKNNLIKKLFPNYQTKKELRKKIELLEISAITNGMTSINKLENLKIRNTRIKRIFRGDTPNFIIENAIYEEIKDYIKNKNLAKIEIETNPVTEDKYCTAELRILPPEKRKGEING